MKSLILVSTVITIISIPKAFAIHCYVCTSNLDLNCHDPFLGRPYYANNHHQYPQNNFYTNGNPSSWGDTGSLVNCDDRSPIGYVNRFAGHSACMKQKIREDDGRVTITRSCVFSPMSYGDCSRNPQYLNNRGYLEFCEICDEHGCNSGVKLSSMLLFSLSLTLISSFLLKFMWEM